MVVRKIIIKNIALNTLLNFFLSMFRRHRDKLADGDTQYSFVSNGLEDIAISVVLKEAKTLRANDAYTSRMCDPEDGEDE